ncbi:MAG: YdcH family protein [Limnohabitans sp.]
MDSPFEDLRSPQRQLIEWQIEHADLDALIDQTSLNTPTTLDELSLRRLKKRRLALRDQIARLQIMLDPKEPA